MVEGGVQVDRSVGGLISILLGSSSSTSCMSCSHLEARMRLTEVASSWRPSTDHTAGVVLGHSLSLLLLVFDSY